MPDYRIELELAEPLFCGARPAVSNEMSSLEFIPGASLRGALAAELVYSGRAGDVPAWFSAGGPLWTPALPLATDGLKNRLGTDDLRIVPMPLAFAREKSDADPFEGDFGVWNTLFSPPPGDDLTYQSATGRTRLRDEQGKQQWTALRAPWLVVRAGQPAAEFRPQSAASMHVGLHYGRQANREEALFSRRAIGAKTRFEAWVQDAGGRMGDNFPSSALIGKRTSSGNGRVLLRWHKGSFPWAGNGGSDAPEATVQLISDAVVLDADGNYLQGLDACWWTQRLGVPVTVQAAATASRVVRGWSTAWGLPRDYQLVISAGSIFRLHSPGGGRAWRVALDRLAADGVGSLRHEGFGWVSVNPPWTAHRFYPPAAPDPKWEEERRKRDAGPKPWPGMDGVDAALVRAAAHDAREVAHQLKGEGAREKVGELGAFAARVKDPAAVMCYLTGMGRRTKPRQWDDLARVIEGPLGRCESIELVQFFLSAVETLA